MARPSYSIKRKSVQPFFTKLKLLKMNFWMPKLFNDTKLSMLWKKFDFYLQVDLFMVLLFKKCCIIYLKSKNLCTHCIYNGSWLIKWKKYDTCVLVPLFHCCHFLQFSLFAVTMLICMLFCQHKSRICSITLLFEQSFSQVSEIEHFESFCRPWKNQLPEQFFAKFNLLLFFLIF